MRQSKFMSSFLLVLNLSLLVLPLLLRWHHAWLIATWNSSAMLFFLPGRPQVWMGLAAASFTIAILQYTLNRRMKFLHVPSVARPLIFFTAVVLLTARLTGGLAVRVLGGDTYGGKNYFIMFAAILGYFAIINRQIPPKRANLYVALFFLGGATPVIGELGGRVSPALNFLFLLFPLTSMSAFTDQHSVAGPTSLVMHLFGLSTLGMMVFNLMLARYGIRGVLDTAKPLRLGVFCFFVLVGLLGGFRGTLVIIVMTFGLLFFLERLHQTRLLLPVILVSLAIGGLATLFATRLPLPLQRTLAVVPFIQVDPLAKISAETSSNWRLEMWRDLLPQIPRYLLVGKGYAFSANEQMQLAMSRQSMESTELTGNYHNGPLSVILPFGIFGSIAFVWLLAAGIRVVYDNYQFGDPAYHNANTFLFAYFVVKVIFFFAVFGGLSSDLPTFLGLLGLSISLNGGVAKPAFVPQPKMVFNRFKLHPSVRRPIGA